MNTPYLPLAGPEAVPTSEGLQLVASPTLVPQSWSNSGLSPASTASVAIFLSLFGLAVLAFAICWIRKRRITPKVLEEQPLEKAAVRDVEALGAAHPIVPVSPLPDVRWIPQIRSISGPVLNKSPNGKLAALAPKRARSPPPSIKPQSLFPDPCVKSAPAYALTFSQNDTSRSEKSSREGPSPPVTPQALAVSGMQTRSLGRPG